MKDCKRIENGDFLFGIGLTISEILCNYLKEQQIEDNDVATITLLEDDEEVNYDGTLEEIRNICKNEGFYFVATKYFTPITENMSEHYSAWNDHEFIIMKHIDIDDEQSQSIYRSIDQFKKLHDYFQLDGSIERINYHFYFPENILIDNDGNGLCKVTIESEWDHNERYGEHGD